MGGAQYQAKVLIEHLLANYDVEIFFLTTRSHEGFRPRQYAIVPIVGFGALRRYGKFLDAPALYRVLVRLRPDIVYQQVGCGHTGVAAFYARRAGARMVWRVSSDRTVMPRRIEWWRFHHRIEQRFLEYGIRRADLILAQTQTQKAQLAKHYGRSDAVVVPNFHPVPERTERVKAADLKQVVWIANFKALKNPHAFVRLAQRFADRNDVRFVMAGAAMLPGQWTDDLLRLIEKVPNLRYLGALEQDEVNGLLECSHLLVNTSDYEGFSNTFIQAWMREVPVVSLRVDPDRLLSAGKIGFVSGDEERLSRDVGRLLEDNILREEMGEHARDYAVRNHSTAKIEEMARLMQLDRRSASAPIDEVALRPYACHGSISQ
jgi:glycosyltransferase involved in cell wall biosynthesis